MVNSSEKQEIMEDDEVKRIIKEASKESVHETLTGLGFNVYSPQEMQANLIYLQKIRKGSEFLSLRLKASLVAVLIPTLLYGVWEIIKNSLKQ